VPACIVNINGGDRLAAEFLKPHEQFVISDNSSSATGRPPILVSRERSSLTWPAMRE
jgi:hypothetical protein